MSYVHHFHFFFVYILPFILQEQFRKRITGSGYYRVHFGTHLYSRGQKRPTPTNDRFSNQIWLKIGGYTNFDTSSRQDDQYTMKY